MGHPVMFYIGATFLLLLVGRTARAEPSPSPRPYNPYFGVFPYASPYVNYIDSYPFHPPPSAYAPPPTLQATPSDAFIETADQPAGAGAEPALQLVAEAPSQVSASFRVVPLLVVGGEGLQVLTDTHVLQASRRLPSLTVKTAGDELVQVTPAARIPLRPPLPVHALRTLLPFPDTVDIQLGGVTIRMEVGALIAPVHSGSYISAQSPAAVSEVYAVPTRPVELAYAPSRDAVELPEQQAVLVESQVPAQPPRNVTVLDFPEAEAEPVLQVDENDDELVNRNPPQVLAPAGIVQSTQPQSSVQPFHNSKESPILTALREEAQKRVR